MYMATGIHPAKTPIYIHKIKIRVNLFKAPYNFVSGTYRLIHGGITFSLANLRSDFSLLVLLLNPPPPLLLFSSVDQMGRWHSVFGLFKIKASSLLMDLPNASCANLLLEVSILSGCPSHKQRLWFRYWL